MGTQHYRVRSGEDLGRVLRDARTAQGLTQQQLVDQLELGFDRTRLARIEAGEGFQSLDRALSVLRRLGIEVYATVPEPAHPNDHHRTDLDDRADADEGERDEEERQEERQKERDEDDRKNDRQREDGGGFR
jgi:transcriptional regulator with XRE-family HTH domain